MKHIIIGADGNIRFIWADEFSELVEAGKPVIKRASNVEPTVDGQWIADMRLIGGPVIGPYTKREEALVRERQWLMDNGY